VTFTLAACSSNNNSSTGSADSGTSGDATTAIDAGREDGGNDATARDGAATDASADATNGTDATSDASDASDAGTGDAADAGPPPPANAVYTMSNAATNQVFGFLRGADGSLAPMAAPFATGGIGSGAGLGEQGAVAYDLTNNRLYVVNAGDGSFSVLPVKADGTLGTAVKVNAASASLVGPKSITFSGNTVYVLYEGNATTASMIAGYTVTPSGATFTAAPITGSALALSSNVESVDPAEIKFSPDGAWLVVTEKQSGGTGVVAGPGSIDTFGVDSTGLATRKGFYSTASAQLTPYGFAFLGGTLIVSEAGSAGVGTYSYTNGVIAPEVPASGGLQFLPTDAAPCWVAVSSDWAYVANAMGPDISGFTVDAVTGGLTDIGAVANGVVASTGKVVVTDAGTTIDGPTDESVSADGKFLYVLESAVPSIGIFQIMTNGTLVRVGAEDYSPTGGVLPLGAVGIAAR
jgi:hypothetical protein